MTPVFTWPLTSSCLTSDPPGIRVLVDAREKLHIPWGDPDNQRHGDAVMAFDTRSAQMANGQLETLVFLRYLSAIKALWEDSGVQNAYDRRREFQLVGGGGPPPAVPSLGSPVSSSCDPGVRLPVCRPSDMRLNQLPVYVSPLPRVPVPTR